MFFCDIIGTGKTLIAREIAKALNSRTPLIINGPEVLDKFIGEAEKTFAICLSLPKKSGK